MRVRSPPHDPSEHHLTPTPLPNRSGPSQGAAEATAHDDQQESLADGAHDQHELPVPHHDGSHLNDDRLSDVHDHDRPVSGSSWDGGLAL